MLSNDCLEVLARQIPARTGESHDLVGDQICHTKKFIFFCISLVNESNCTFRACK